MPERLIDLNDGCCQTPIICLQTIAQNEVLPLTNIATSQIAASFPFFSGDYTWRHLQYWCDWLISWLQNVAQVSM